MPDPQIRLVTQMKNKPLALMLLPLLLVLLAPPLRSAQVATDPRLLDEISKIRAIDNHAHPLRVGGEGENPEDEYDALPLEGLEPFSLPPRLSATNLEYLAAWR